ncbi:MAG TPA: DUF1552 domain-containing protein [Polyangia bacterium]
MKRDWKNWDPRLPRRAFLRGLGALVALPPLESLGTATAFAATGARPGPATTATGAPLRMMFIGFPNGVNLSHWRPTGVGRDFTLNKTFAPLAPLKKKVQLFTGFAQMNADALGDGPGDHARSNATFLTGCHARKTAGANIRNGISVDQVAAQKVGSLTRLPSIELICTRSRRSGSCDSGYSCAYEYNLSWASETVPVPAESDPRQVFERLFGAGPAGDRQRLYRQRQRQRKSLLDFVADDARAMQKELGGTDRRKLGEYLDGLRAVERQIELAEKYDLPTTNVRMPEQLPDDHGARVRLMFDLTALAFATDSTRIATMLYANEGNNRSFGELGIAEGHHHLSHHQKKAENLDKVARIDLYYMEQFAYFLRKLEAAKDPGGRSVLDNSMILYGGGISDGDLHNHDDLPIVVAGGGGAGLQTGRHVKLDGRVPLNNLFLGMLDRMGAPTAKMGDSTAVYTDI